MILNVHQLKITRNSRRICECLTLSVKPGEVWGVLGPNASGKTTLLHCMAGLFPPQAGEICINGQSLKTMSRKRIAQTIGLLLQESTNIFGQNAYDYCLTSRFPHINYFQPLSQHDHRRTTAALGQLELASKKNTTIDRLSGGERKRLHIAALLTQDPQIFLLDEPTNHLDLRYQKIVLSIFSKLAKEQGKTVIISLHDINHAQAICDHILLIYPSGTHIVGPTKKVLTEINLRALYDCCIKQLAQDDMALWYVDTVK